MAKINTSKAEYKTMVEKASPNSKLLSDCLKAFFVGGLICCIGQLIANTFGYYGFGKADAGLYSTVILVFLAAFLTGIGVYDKLGKFAGAGSVVPITGFSNSVAAPAIEFKKEGFVLGVGAKMFLIAGPVIVYGTLSSTAIGVIYFIVKQVGGR